MDTYETLVEELNSCSHSDLWETINKVLEKALKCREDVQLEKKQTEEHAKGILEALVTARDCLGEMKSRVASLEEDFKNKKKEIYAKFEEANVDIKEAIKIHERNIAVTLISKESEVNSLIKNCDFSSIKTVKQTLDAVTATLIEFEGYNLRDRIDQHLNSFLTKCSDKVQFLLWNFLHENQFPAEVPSEDEWGSESSNFYENLTLFATVIGSLELMKGNGFSKGFSKFASLLLGLVENMSIELLDTGGSSDYQWPFNCLLTWSDNSKTILKKVNDSAEMKLKVSSADFDTEYEEVFSKTVNNLVQRIIDTKGIDISLFTTLLPLLQKLSQDRTVDFCRQFYSPNVLQKWILLESERWSLEIGEVIDSERCFQQVTSSVLVRTSDWISELLVFVVQYFEKYQNDVEKIKDGKIQTIFFDLGHLFLKDLQKRIHQKANQLYYGTTWPSDVYLVMNTVWELTDFIETSTLAWPVSTFKAKKLMTDEYDRLARMILDYLTGTVDELDSELYNHRPCSDEFQKICKCLQNVTNKASKASRNELLNKLVGEVFKDLNIKFIGWKQLGNNVLESVYEEIYSNFLQNLHFMAKKGVWEPSEETRKDMTELDVVMKNRAISDPSGALVSAAFKTIDEEQIEKMLNKLGLKSTKNHPLHDFQILAENWVELQEM